MVFRERGADDKFCKLKTPSLGGRLLLKERCKRVRTRLIRTYCKSGSSERAWGLPRGVYTEQSEYARNDGACSGRHRHLRQISLRGFYLFPRVREIFQVSAQIS